MKRLVSPGLLAFRLLANTMNLPSGLNIGNDSNTGL